MAAPSINPRYVVATKRREKALKIESVLRDFSGKPIENLAILDVGVGTGEIIDYFSQKNATQGVDIQDQRTSRNSPFQLVAAEQLPFAENFFDIVISNHVIEHVRSPEAHLNELHRVLKPGGIVYLATPNYFFPKETHFKLWLLHYFPGKIYFSVATKLGRPAERFWIFSPFQLKRLTAKANFQTIDYTGRILAHPGRFNAKSECPIGIGSLLGGALKWISPTMIQVLKRTEKSAR
jgi:2-polyprenyl-3-methyl-5-hydroxy-6-metoxy-1,4-benzoquinol methylase